MNKFVMPAMEIVSFDSNDVIATSGIIIEPVTCTGDCSEFCNPHCPGICWGHCGVITTI